MKEYPLYKHPHIETIRDLLCTCEQMYGEKECFRYSKGKKDIVITYKQFKQEVIAVGTWFYKKGFRNCHIALFGENCYEWILSYFAITCGANTAVPIDKELGAENVLDLMVNSDCSIIIYSDTYADVIRQVKILGESGYSYICMSEIINAIMERSRFLESESLGFKEISIKKDTLASIVFTSGTTGKSKGVMLSHYNMISNLYAASQYVALSGPSILLLPLHHMFGLVAGVFSVMFYGYPLYINNSFRYLLNDFQKCRPQNVFAVPLIVETLYKNIWSTAKKRGKDKLLRRMVQISNMLRKCKIDLRKVIFKSVLSSFGGAFELIICGGAPLDEKYIREFESLGIIVLNGYGITECAPIVAVNRNYYNHIGSVGLPLACNEVAIATDGEVLVRGSNVMRGYYRNEAEDEKVFENGWFKTGDLGKLGIDGELYITGRKKNLIILSNGENIPAEIIEKEVYNIPYVKEVIAYGENDKIVAEIYLDEEYLEGKIMIHKDIKKINRELPQAKNIAKVMIRDTEFPKTTTKKIKRFYKE